MMFLPLFYKNILDKYDPSKNKEFIKFMNKTYINEPKYSKLLNLIDKENMPVELLCKYYARIYTIEGNSYKDMKTDLLSDNYEKKKIIYHLLKLYLKVLN